MRCGGIPVGPRGRGGQRTRGCGSQDGARVAARLAHLELPSCLLLGRVLRPGPPGAAQLGVPGLPFRAGPALQGGCGVTLGPRLRVHTCLPLGSDPQTLRIQYCGGWSGPSFASELRVRQSRDSMAAWSPRELHAGVRGRRCWARAGSTPRPPHTQRGHTGPAALARTTEVPVCPGGAGLLWPSTRASELGGLPRCPRGCPSLQPHSASSLNTI